MPEPAPSHPTPPPFPGFGLPEQNWFKLPNNWTDITASITSLAELKVVEYVLKHTWGYHEYGLVKRITTDEFMYGRKRKDGGRIDRGTGLSNRSVIDGLKRAVEEGYLIEEVNANLIPKGYRPLWGVPGWVAEYQGLTNKFVWLP